MAAYIGQAHRALSGPCLQARHCGDLQDECRSQDQPHPRETVEAAVIRTIFRDAVLDRLYSGCVYPY